MKKNYKCLLCGKIYNKASSINSHLRSFHHASPEQRKKGIGWNPTNQRIYKLGKSKKKAKPKTPTTKPQSNQKTYMLTCNLQIKIPVTVGMAQVINANVNQERNKQ